MSRLAQLQQMLVDEPNDSFLHYALGMEYVKLGDAEQGVRQFASMNAAFPDHVAAWHQRGRLLADRGEADAAREVLQHGIAVAQRTGDDHAAGEMQGLIDMLQTGW
jgi:tetratricopeptide (TPR) repeat protein